MSTFDSYCLVYSGQDFAELSASAFELVITEGAPFGDYPAFTDQQVETLQGQGRTVIGYVNVGVVDDTRPYWNPAWTDDGTDQGVPTASAPDWLKNQPSNAFGIMPDFWDDDWKDLVIAQAVELVERGYDGVFLDDIGSYWLLAQTAGQPAVNQLALWMMEFVLEIDAAIRAVNPDAYLAINGDPYIMANSNLPGGPVAVAFRAAVDAMLLENQTTTVWDYAVDHMGDHTQILALSNQGDPYAFADEAWNHKVIPYASPDGDYLQLGPYFAPQGVNWTGTAGADDLTGSAYDDVLSGLGGNDTLRGGDGDDILRGGTGDDILIGGLGRDTADYSQAAAKVTIDLTRAVQNNAEGVDQLIEIENITGSEFDDRITGDDRGNVIRGGAGGDTLIGGGGNDFLYAGAGGGWGDSLHGQDGDDRLYGSDARDSMYGGDGDDTLRGEGGSNSLRGEAGNDTIYGGSGVDTVFGGTGADKVYAGGGDDKVWGGDQNDSLRGQDGNDELLGEAGNDFLYGDAGDDRIEGGAGTDAIWGGVGADNLYGLDAYDRVYGQDGDDMIWGGLGNDHLWGNDDNDSLRGEDGNDTLRGDNGDDYLYGQNGTDTLYGGEGLDRVYGGAGADQFYGAGGDDRLFGEADGDSLRGEAGNDFIYGGDGADFLYGGDGADRLEGGTGADRMYGHTGADIFWFDDGHMTPAGVAIDRIHDFNAAEGDIIDLSAVDADSILGGDQAFTLVSAFTGEAGEYFLQTFSTYVIAQFDTNGDGGADLVLRIDGTTDGTTGWVL